MGEIYLMEKNGFEKFVGYTVGKIEEFMMSIKIVSVNGKSKKPYYVIQKNDTALIEMGMPQIKKVSIKD